MSNLVPSETKYCVHCGYQLSSEAKYCSKCGKRQQVEVAAHAGVMDFLRRNGHWLFLLALLYIVLPFDIISDILPCAGWVDDAFAGVTGVSSLALKAVGGKIISDEAGFVIVAVVLFTIVGVLTLVWMLLAAGIGN